MTVTLRWKVFVISGALVCAAMAAYLFLAERSIRKERLAFAYELDAAFARTRAAHVRADLLGKADRLVALDARDPVGLRGLIDGDPEVIAVRWWTAGGALGGAAIAHERLAPLGLEEADLAAFALPGWLDAPRARREPVLSNVSRPPDAPLLLLALVLPDGSGRLLVFRPDTLLSLFAGSELHRGFLLDEAGTILVHSDPARMLARESLADRPEVAFALTAQGRGAREAGELLVSFAPAGIAGITVFGEAPREEIARSIALLLRRSVVFALSVLLVTLFLANRLSRAVARPLIQLERATREIGEGRFGTQVPESSRDEIGRLAASFNTMSRELKDREARLGAAQAALAQSDRMVLVGTMAAGIAHEINNPLSYVIANLSFVRDELARLRRTPNGALQAGDPSFDELLQAVEDSSSGADRVRLIVGDVKLFARKDSNERSVVDVREVLTQSLRMVTGDLRQRARIETDLSEVPLVMANPARLGQVFLNLLVNALHALPEGEASRNMVRVSVRAENGGVVVEVSDTGSGIPEEILDRIFDPFFTTKPPGIGTGLGLSICHGIIENLGGRISVRSSPGRGSTFQVCLPAADPGEVRVPPAADGPSPLPLSARILIVDDERLVLAALSRMLPNHRTELMPDSQEALARIRAEERGFDVILCDLIMPGMTGMDLFDRVTSERPEYGARFVFMTGGATTPAARAFLERVANERVEKPFSASDVESTLARAMRHTSPD